MGQVGRYDTCRCIRQEWQEGGDCGNDESWITMERSWGGVLKHVCCRLNDDSNARKMSSGVNESYSVAND